jgi:hypothetical protein
MKRRATVESKRNKISDRRNEIFLTMKGLKTLLINSVRPNAIRMTEDGNTVPAKMSSMANITTTFRAKHNQNSKVKKQNAVKLFLILADLFMFVVHDEKGFEATREVGWI